MLIRCRPGARRILRWSFLVGTVWFILSFILKHPVDFNVHTITPSDMSQETYKTVRDLNELEKSALLSSPVAREFCRAHGYSPFHTSPATPRRRVYDLLLLNTELDWLEIHLETLYDYVDYFVIVEATKTFTSRPKPLHLSENWDRFEKWRSKIIYHALDYPADWDPPRPWDFEDLQRDSTFVQVIPTLPVDQKPRYGDVIIVADLDEIPRPATVALLRSCVFSKRLTLRSRFYYYSFQFLHRGPEWEHPQATYYTSDQETIKPVNLRNGDGGVPVARELEKADLWNAAWHCSSCFNTVAELLNKMASFSHVPLNKEKYRDPKRIADRVRTGSDLWDREGQFYDRIDGNEDVPPMLMRDPVKWRYMLDRSGESAGFSDYP
ncbi:glycosyl transferase family 17 protein [Zalerion maritima]|uniref:Glycosyl transferase family 17 protein n=1 Tax=Zalerion maritima TaxID=339359 RepID=A0AAD5RIE2_9PEZI|nr:glycosyl transferase family 17 protein [Zalerion maritima]